MNTIQRNVERWLQERTNREQVHQWARRKAAKQIRKAQERAGIIVCKTQLPNAKVGTNGVGGS